MMRQWTVVDAQRLLLLTRKFFLLLLLLFPVGTVQVACQFRIVNFGGGRNFRRTFLDRRCVAAAGQRWLAAFLVLVLGFRAGEGDSKLQVLFLLQFQLLLFATLLKFRIGCLGRIRLIFHRSWPRFPVSCQRTRV